MKYKQLIENFIEEINELHSGSIELTPMPKSTDPHNVQIRGTGKNGHIHCQSWVDDGEIAEEEAYKRLLRSIMLHGMYPFPKIVNGVIQD